MESKFWLKYQSLVIKQKVSSKAVEWYVRWAQNFDKAFPDVPLLERTKEDVQTYLNSLVCRKKYQKWQLEQANDAIRILLSVYLYSQPS